MPNPLDMIDAALSDDQPQPTLNNPLDLLESALQDDSTPEPVQSDAEKYGPAVIAQRLKNMGIGHIPFASDILGGFGAVADSAIQLGGSLLGMDDVVKENRKKSELRIAGLQELNKDSNIPGWVRGAVGNAPAQLSKAMALGPAAPFVFAAEGMNEARLSADEAGVTGAAKYGNIAVQGVVEAFGGHLLRKFGIVNPQQVIPKTTAKQMVADFIKSGVVDSAEFGGLNVASVLSDKLSKGQDIKAEDLLSTFGEGVLSGYIFKGVHSAAEKAAAFKQAFPDKAAALAESGRTSRRALEEAGIVDHEMNADARKEFVTSLSTDQANIEQYPVGMKVNRLDSVDELASNTTNGNVQRLMNQDRRRADLEEGMSVEQKPGYSIEKPQEVEAATAVADPFPVKEKQLTRNELYAKAEELGVAGYRGKSLLKVQEMITAAEASQPVEPPPPSEPVIEAPGPEVVEQDGQMTKAMVYETAKAMGIKGYKGKSIKKVSEMIEEHQEQAPETDSDVPDDPLDDTPSELAMQDADARPNLEAMGSMGGNVLLNEKVRGDDTVAGLGLKSMPKEVADRFQAAKGSKSESILDRVKRVATAAVQVTRAQEHLANTGKNATSNEFFRLHKVVPDASRDRAVRTIAAIVDPLNGPKQKTAYETYLQVKNMQEAVRNGEPLRMGFTKESLDATASELEGVVNNTPEVKRAIEQRQAVKSEVLDKLLERGLLSEEAVSDREFYYHQQINDKIKVQRLGAGGGKFGKKSFQKQRVKGDGELGQEYDYNTDYIEAEAAWLTDAYTKIAEEDLLRQLDKTQGIQLKKGQRIPEGYAEWSPQPGNHFYRSSGTAGQVAEAALQSMVKDGGITSEEAAATLPQRKTMILPENVVAQLNATQKAKAPGEIAKASADILSTWKSWMINAPNRIIKSAISNMSGDIDAAFAGAPGAFKKVPKILGELQDFYATKKLATSEDLRQAVDLGVLSASMAAQEIKQIKSMGSFKRFYDEKSGRWDQKALGQVAGGIDAVQKIQNFREATMRYAAFKHFKEELSAGTLKDYAGSKKEVIDSIHEKMGVEYAAAKLSRDMLGDYGNLSVAGNWLRKNALPFWSYQEINMKRYPRFLINAFKNRGAAAGAGTAAYVGAKAMIGLATARTAAMYAVISAVNHFTHPEEEEDLSRADRSSPHLTLGRNADGSVNLARNIGASGEFLEWFGINSLLGMADKLKKGQMSANEAIIEMLKDPANKVIQSIRPEAKGALEAVTGKSLFPDAFNPRTVDPAQATAQTLGVGEEFKAVKGAITKDGTRAAPHYLKKYAMGVSDVDKNALGEMYDLINAYKRSKGKDPKPFDGPASPIAKMRTAATDGNYEAFKEARTVYLKDNKFKNFSASLKKLDPVDREIKDEADFEDNFLTETQRKKLYRVRDYAQRTRTKMYEWWRKAFDEDEAAKK